MARTRAIAFDALGTLFSLDGLLPSLEWLGLSRDDRDLWMARTLRDGFALAATDTFWSFEDVARATLTRLLDDRSKPPQPSAEEEVFAAFSTLTPYGDVQSALLGVRARGVLTAVLTNGERDSTLALLEHNGLGQLFDAVVTAGEVAAWKPRPEPYLAAADVLGVAPGELALVAAHGWDVHGARRAGLMTGYVERGAGPRSHVFEPPDVEGRGLVAVCDALVPPARPSRIEASP